MTERPEHPSTKDLLEMIVRLEARAELADKHIIELNDQIGKVFNFYEQLLETVETLQIQRVTDYHNAQIEEKLREYEAVHGSQIDGGRYVKDDMYRRVTDEERRKAAKTVLYAPRSNTNGHQTPRQGECSGEKAQQKPEQ